MPLPALPPPPTHCSVYPLPICHAYPLPRTMQKCLFRMKGSLERKFVLKNGERESRSCVWVGEGGGPRGVRLPAATPLFKHLRGEPCLPFQAAFSCLRRLEGGWQAGRCASPERREISRFGIMCLLKCHHLCIIEL